MNVKLREQLVHTNLKLKVAVTATNIFFIDFLVIHFVPDFSLLQFKVFYYSINTIGLKVDKYIYVFSQSNNIMRAVSFVRWRNGKRVMRSVRYVIKQYGIYGKFDRTIK